MTYPIITKSRTVVTKRPSEASHQVRKGAGAGQVENLRVGLIPTDRDHVIAEGRKAPGRGGVVALPFDTSS